MKTLSKVIMVQWFRMHAVEIPIVGHTAIVGENGAGKSALLDAIQTVITGANKKFLVLNRGSNEKSDRQLWEYVLGLLSDPKDPELAARVKPREKATCYLALNFHDNERNETTCVGLGLYASLADMSEKVEGYFICPGLVGTKELFLDPGEGARPVVLPWVRIKERLGKMCGATRFHQEPGKFTADLYTTMSEHAGVPNNDKTVLKAIQAGVSLDKIANPTDFIRKYMLDRDDLQIKELQSALKNYRDMAEKADSVSRRVSVLTRLEACCEKVETGRAQQVVGQYINLCARIEDLEEKADPVRDALAVLEETKERLTGQLADFDGKRAALLEELGQKRAEYKNSDLENQRRSLQLDIERNEANDREASAKITELRRLLQKLENLKSTPSTEGLTAAITDICNLLPKDDMVSMANWPEKPSEMDLCLGSLREALDKALPILNTRYNGLCGDLDVVEKSEKSLVEKLKQLERGKPPLNPSTQGLIQFLKSHGVDAKPLCDLVDVTNETWRNTIESILGSKREALVVIPEQVKKAVNLYRYEGRKDFPGCSVVNTTKTDQYKDARKKGSIAEHLSSYNMHALAFINRQMGSFICVESEKDLLLHDRAATADGMISSSGLISETRQVAPILGRASRDILKATYQKELSGHGARKESLEKDRKQLGALKGVLEDYKRGYGDDATFSLEALVAKRAASQRILNDLRKRLEAMALDVREKNLAAEIQLLEQQAEKVKGEIAGLTGQLRAADTDFAQKEEMLKQFDRDRGTLQEIMKAHRANPLLDPAAGAELLDRWREQTQGDFVALLKKAEEFTAAAQNSIERNMQLIVKDYAEYHLQYAAEEGDDSKPEEFSEYAGIIRKKKQYLEGTTLAEYRDKSARALREAEDTFRAKFVGRLVGKLDAVRNQISQLNMTLAKHPFHRETYHFKQSPNPEFKHIIDFAKACSSQAAQELGGLFDPATNDPENPHRKALDDITTALQDPKAAERLQDYRNFLVFDVEMRDAEGNRTANLGHRIKKGSGGENQTPFYVAIGASLAAAYRLKEEYGKYYGGMSLSLFDEAFSKLSIATCLSCIEFLQTIQLQLVLAAPDDKFTTMAEVMDTIIWVSREGGTVSVDVVSIKPAMRSLLRADNPYRAATGAGKFIYEPE